MTLNQSLFNNGIFKNTLKRFKWGSFLYFIILFFTVPFRIIITNRDYISVGDSFFNNDIILREDYFVFPMLMAFVVPAVVSALVYRFIHSKSYGTATHILPVGRKKVYFSTVAASFVLMLAPIVLNAVIVFFSLLIKGCFSPFVVIYWMFINIAVIFIMFSVSTFSAFLTGHTAANIAVNCIIHILMPACALGISVISDAFLYGFVPSHGAFTDKLIEYTPVVYLMSMVF